MNSTNQEAQDLFRRGLEELSVHNVLSALRLAEEAAAKAPEMPGVHALLAECLGAIGRLQDALAATDIELKIAPDSPKVAQYRNSVLEAIANSTKPVGQDRQWSTSLKPETYQRIEGATHRYTYRGHAMIKNPFDIALYQLLLWNTKPATIFEIGSYNGASALWMADLLRNYGVDFHIWSLDVVKVSRIVDPNITFLAGSGRDLPASFQEEFLADCPRPFLVIDDADHMYETSKAVCEFFHPLMRQGEYMVVEDGLTAEGPRRAVHEFMETHGDDYIIDADYCDFFGYNATWCINGFLRRK